MQVIINNEDVTQYIVLPIKTDEKLDESLDGSVITLLNTPFSNAFEPLSIVEIKYDDTSEFWCVGADVCDTQTMCKNKFYRHDITLAETTKILEGYIVPNLTFTNTLGTSLVEGQQAVIPDVLVNELNWNIQKTNAIYTPIIEGTIVTFPSLIEYFNSQGYYYKKIGVNYSIGGYIAIRKRTVVMEKTEATDWVNVFEDNTGKKEIVLRPDTLNRKKYWISYIFEGVPENITLNPLPKSIHVYLYVDTIEQGQIIKSSPITITDVVNRILSQTEILNNYEAQRFNFNKEQLDKYRNVESPEFTITRKNLYEALRDVGGYIHAIPRLKIERNEKYDAPLPSEYQEVEYIESNGEQYIDTGLPMSANSKFELDFKLSNINNQTLFGAGVVFYPNTNTESTDYSFNVNNNNFNIVNNRFNEQTLTIKEADTNRHFLYQNNLQVVFDEEVIGDLIEIRSSVLNIYLFAKSNRISPNPTRVATDFSSFKLYSFKMYENDNVVRNFIPCYRKEDGEIGLYDLVTNVFFENQGNGEFLKGESVIYEQPEFLQHIYFDELGSQNQNDLKGYSQQKETTSIEQYCDNIDSIVDNLVNVTEEDGGAVYEPAINSYRTVRTETTNVIINESNVIIKTDYPIMKINRVQVLYNQTDYAVITDYIYEKHIYDLLSSYLSSPSNSKAYALYYTQGENNIYGLNFKNTDINITGTDAFKNFAIENIIQQVQNLSSVPSVVMTQLAFQIEYIPIVSMRVKQHKQYIDSANNDRSIIYEQQSNMVDNKYYGENLKGVVARFGNPEKQETYILKSITEKPIIGTIKGDYYISEILTERLKNYIKCTVQYSKDFNRWNEFVGIKNNLRQYEISERMTTQRYDIYEDFCILGEPLNESITQDNKTLLTNNGLKMFSHIFDNTSGFAIYEVSQARIGIDDIDGEYQERIGLPLLSYYLGNSTVFSFKFEDNYGAGYQSFNSADGELNYTTTEKRIQQALKYTNIYGKFNSFKLNITSWGDTSSNSNNYVYWGNKLPQIDDLEPNSTLLTPEQNIVFSTENMNIRVQKDSREQINFSYQMNFVTNQYYIIIGSGLAKSFFVGSYEGTNKAKAYISPRKINKFESKIDTTELIPIYDFENTDKFIVNYEDKSMSLDTIKNAPVDGESIVVVNPATNEILWAENKEIKAGEPVSLATLSFRHHKRSK